MTDNYPQDSYKPGDMFFYGTAEFMAYHSKSRGCGGCIGNQH